MIKTNQLQMILAIENSESLTQAAEIMHLSVSAITKAIRNLETELGVPLLDRTGYRVSLNQFGICLASHARNVISELEDTKRNLLLLRDSAENQIRISAPPALMSEFLPKAINVLRQRIPDALIHLNTTDNINSTGTTDLANGLCDLAISPIIPGEDLSLFTFDPFVRITVIIAASKNHPARKIKNPTLKQLNNFDWIFPSISGLPFDVIQTIFHDHGADMPTKIHVMPTREMALRMLKQDGYLGVLVNNDTLFTRPPNKILKVDFDSQKYAFTQYIFQRKYSTTRPIVTSFIEVMKELMTENL